MTRTRPLLAFGFVLFTACATQSEMRADSPIGQFNSRKPPKDVAECIHEAWSDMKIGGTAMGAYLASRGEGFVVTSNGQPPLELADVLSVAGGSEIRIHEQKGVADWRGRRYVEAAQACK